MIKKLDKLILTSFFGPFFLTFFITVFILLLQFMLKYFDDIIGKGLEFTVLMEFLMYFSIRITPDALPLAILLSSLMTFGNLGEHFELTAIKSAGISLVRAIQPIFIFSIFLSIAAFFSNNYIVPAANLKALSLLYDIKQKKPSLDLKEGQFYDGIPNYSIKVKEKYPDDITLRDVIIYDHTNGVGNNRVIYADSSRMYTFMNDRYLMFELFNGHLFEEYPHPNEMIIHTGTHINQFTRNSYEQMKIVFSLESFDLKRTKEDLFAGDYRMKKIEELQYDIDSMSRISNRSMFNLFKSIPVLYKHHMVDKIDMPQHFVTFEEELESIRKQKQDTMTQEQLADVANEKVAKEERAANAKLRSDSLRNRREQRAQNRLKTNTPKTPIVTTPKVASIAADTTIVVDSLANLITKKLVTYPKDSTWQSIVAFVDPKFQNTLNDERKKRIALDNAMSAARNIKSSLNNNAARVVTTQREVNKYSIELYRKYAQAAACFSMFLIGAPLGAIIKKGGLGVPVIISIFFYIAYYVLNILSIKWARESIMDPLYAAWLSNIILFPIGLFFLKQARKDARIFDSDVYFVFLDRIQVALKGLISRRGK